MKLILSALVLSTSVLTPLVVRAQQIPTSPAVTFPNSTSPSPGSVIPKLLDSYANLMLNNPSVMTQNIQTVITMTQNRTAAQTLAAIHDDRTAQPYSAMNGLGALTNLFLTGAGASSTGVTPAALTPTTYATATLQNYATNINYLSSASFGSATFSTGAATPLAGAVNFINNIVRANSSTEPPKRTFERYMGTNTAISPLDPRYANYSVLTGGLTPADTANFVVPSYYSNFALPATYATTTQWVQGFTVTQAMINANNGNPITAPNLGTYDAAGNFTPFAFTVGQYVPGIGTAHRPYRLSTAVNVPSQLYQIINNTNPYADGAFPSGHTNSAYLQALGLAFLVPQQYQELLARAADLGNDRILAGMHSPLDVMGGRIEATAITATNIYGALYDANGNRLDWTNPANATAYSVYQAVNQTQNYLAQACGAASVVACIQQATASGANASDPYGNAAQNQANYIARLTYGFTPIGPTNLPEVVPLQAQVLLLTRFPYLTDQQRTDILQSTALPSGYPLLDGNTYDGWGRLDLYLAANGYGAFAGNVTVNMDASQGGYSALDSWSNNIGGTGGLIKQGTGMLALTGTDTYTGNTIIQGGTLVVSGSIANSATTVQTGGTLSGGGTVGALTVQNGGIVAPGISAGTLTVNGAASLQAGSNYTVLVGNASADRLTVSGAATIAPLAKLQLTATGVTGNIYAPLSVGRDFTILSATGGVTGQFGSVAASTLTLNPGTQLSVLYGANTVDLFVTPTYGNLSLAGIAASGNEASAARAVNSLSATPTTGDLTAALGALYAIPSTQSAILAMDQINSALYADLIAADESRALAMAGHIERHLADLRDAAVPVQNDAGWGFWTQGVGQFTDISNSGNTRGLGANTGGAMLGADRAVQPGLLLGGAAAITQTDLGGAGNFISYAGSAYVTAKLDPVFVTGNIGYSFDQYRAKRSINYGTISRGAAGSADGDDFSAGFAVGTRFAAGPVTFEPSYGLQYVLVSRDAFAETGAGALDLNLAQIHHAPLQTNAGLRATTSWTAGDMTIEPAVRLAWLHDLHNRTVTADASFDGVALAASSPKIGRDGAAVGFGLSATNGAGLNLFVDYSGDFRSGETDQTVTAGMRLTW